MIELRGATSQEGAAVSMERLVFKTVAPVETRDWYVKTFGASPESLPADPIASLPGLLCISRRRTPPRPERKGRGLDHIGFEVKNLEEFCKKLEAAGQKFDRPYGRLPNSTTAIAFLPTRGGRISS